MKKRLILILAIVLILSILVSLFSFRGLTPKKVEKAMEGLGGTLNMETTGNKVSSFTYEVKGVNAEKLMDANYCREALLLVSSNSGKVTMNHLYATKALIATMSAVALLKNKNDSNVADYIEEVLAIVCNGKHVTYNGWTLYTSVNIPNNSITISVSSK